MVCSLKHRARECPRCFSKMKKVELSNGNRSFRRSSKMTACHSLALCSLLASTAIIATLASFNNYAYAADDNWYVGEGAKQDTYVTYRIQDLD